MMRGYHTLSFFSSYNNNKLQFRNFNEDFNLGHPALFRQQFILALQMAPIFWLKTF